MSSLFVQQSTRLRFTTAFLRYPEPLRADKAWCILRRTYATFETTSGDLLDMSSILRSK